MKVIVRGRGVALPAALREQVEAKVGKVTRFLPKVREARVVLAVEKYRHLADVTLLAKHRTFHCSEVTHDLLSAVDLAMDKLEHQVRRIKDRIRHPKPRPLPKRRLRAPSQKEAQM